MVSARDLAGQALGTTRWRTIGVGAAVACALVMTLLGTGVVQASASPELATATETSGSVTPTTPPGPAWTTIGYSVQGRPISAIRFGSGPKHVLIVAGIHGSEYGYDVARKLVVYLLANPQAVPAGTQLDVIGLANPDGRALWRRGNANGVDLNRNFPARNWRRIRKRGATSGSAPGSEPETQVIMRFMEAGGYSRVISLHSRGPLVDYDGPGAWTLARRIARASRMPIVRLARTGHYYGSMGNWVPQHYRIPIITIELKNRSLPYRLRSGILAALK